MNNESAQDGFQKAINNKEAQIDRLKRKIKANQMITQAISDEVTKIDSVDKIDTKLQAQSKVQVQPKLQG